MAAELKSCPFCGDANPKVVAYRCAEDVEEAFVECRSCGVETDHFEDAYAPRIQAIAAWNRRAALEPAPKPAGGEWVTVPHPDQTSPMTVGPEEFLDEPEAAAWDWLDKTFANAKLGHHPNDRDYSPDEMVDAFIAGRASINVAAPPSPAASLSGGEVRKLEWISVSRRGWWSETSIGNYEVTEFEADGLNTRLSVPVDNYFARYDRGAEVALNAIAALPQGGDVGEVVERLEKLAAWADRSQHEKWCAHRDVPIHGYSGEGKLIREAADLLASLSAKVAEVERERDEAERLKCTWFETHIAHRDALNALGRANGELLKRAMDAETRAALQQEGE